MEIVAKEADLRILHFLLENHSTAQDNINKDLMLQGLLSGKAKKGMFRNSEKIQTQEGYEWSVNNMFEKPGVILKSVLNIDFF